MQWWIVHQRYIHVCIYIYTDTYVGMHICTRTHTQILHEVWLPDNIITLNIVITKHSSVTVYTIICIIYKSTCKKHFNTETCRSLLNTSNKKIACICQYESGYLANFSISLGTDLQFFRALHFLVSPSVIWNLDKLFVFLLWTMSQTKIYFLASIVSPHSCQIFLWYFVAH